MTGVFAPVDEQHDAGARVPVVLLLSWSVITMLLWGMAFYRAPAATPEWLLRAQAACFGTSQTGLPDTYGWMVLILGPVSMLAGMLVALGSDIRRGLAVVAAMRPGRILLGGLVAVLAAEGAWVAGRIQEGVAVASASYEFARPEALPPDYPRLDQEAPPFLLTDQHGARIGPAQLRPRPVLLTFAFAHCQTVCPVILRNVLEVAGRLPPGQVEVLVVTLDPWRDTPSSLPGIARRWGLGDHARILSGSADEVGAVLDAYQVPRQRDPRTGDVTHAPLVYLLDGGGRIAYGFNNPHADWLTAAVRRVFPAADLAATARP